MIKYLEKSGKTEDEALAAALAELGLERDDVSVEIVERAKSGFLGIGASPAVIRVQYEVADEAPAVEEAPAEAEVRAESAETHPESPAKAAPAEYEPKYTEGVKAATESFLHGLLERMGVKAEITIRDRDNGGLLVELAGPGMGAVIGRRGETIDAIQHLTNYAVNRGSEKRCHISVDAGREDGRQGGQVQALDGSRADELLRAPRHTHRPPELRGRVHQLHGHRAQPPRCRLL